MKYIIVEPETYRPSIKNPDISLPVYMPSEGDPCPEGHTPPSLRVTSKHIALGQAADKYHCVLAEAGRDTGAIPEIQRSVAYFEYETHVDKFVPTAKTARGIARFDALAKAGAGALGFGEVGLYDFNEVPYWRTPSGRRATEHVTVKPQGSVGQRGNRDPGGVIQRRAATLLGVRDGSVR